MHEITQNQLRAIAGIILVIIAIYYIYSRADNRNIEIIMVALAGSLIGFSILPSQNNK